MATKSPTNGRTIKSKKNLNEGKKSPKHFEG